MKRMLATVLTLLATTLPAFATGGFSCTIDDANLKLETESAMGRGMGSPFLNLKAHALTSMNGTPNDLQELDLSKHLVHHWVDYPELRLHFYLEREGETPHGTYEIVIMTKAENDEGTYAGDYKLSLFYTEAPADPVTGATIQATGKVKCFVE